MPIRFFRGFITADNEDFERRETMGILRLENKFERVKWWLDGVAIGSAWICTTNNIVLIEELNIEYDYRNQGHGTKFILALAKRYGTLDIVPDSEGSKKLYQKLGNRITQSDDLGVEDKGFGIYRITRE